MAPYEPLPTGDAREPRLPSTLGEGLDRVLRRLGSARSATVGGLHERWEEIVGASIAQHTTPVSVKGGTLLISVDDPAWASELNWLGDEVVARARTVLGDPSIERIEARVRASG